MKKLSKAIAVLLSVMMIFSCMPLSAIAEEAELTEESAVILEETAEEEIPQEESEEPSEPEEEITEEETGEEPTEEPEEVTDVEPEVPAEEEMEEVPEEPAEELPTEEPTEEPTEQEPEEIIPEEPAEEVPSEGQGEEIIGEPSEVPEEPTESVEEEEELEAEEETVAEEAKDVSGSYDSLSWELDETKGILRISGSGYMHNYNPGTDQDDYLPWKTERSKIKTVIIEYGVLSVGDYAFSSCTNLTSVVMADSVKKIGNQAFWACSSLVNVSIPTGVTEIGYMAFASCPALKTVQLPYNLTNIDSKAFSNTNNYAIIRYGKCGADLKWFLNESTGEFDISGTGEMDDYYGSTDPDWYDKKDLIKTVSLAGGVKSIGAYAFYTCENLTSVSLPYGFTAIGQAAFQGCTALKNISLPTTVTSLGMSAFQDCSSITKISIPNVKTIPTYVFENCTSLTEVTIWYKLNYTDSVFNGCNNLTILLSGECGEYATWVLNRTTGVLTISGTGDMYDYGGSSYPEWDEWKNTIKTVKIENGIICIGSYTFYKYSNLKNVTFPAGLITIKDNAFGYCVSLTEIWLPLNCTKVDRYAFEGCTNLVTKRKGECGYSASWVLNMSTGELVISGTGRTYDYPGSTYPEWYPWRLNIKTVKINNGITGLGTYLFYNCNNITSVTIPSSVTSIDTHVFYYCTNLKSITIPSSVKTIGSYAFYNCGNLINITIPSGVTTISTGAFGDCKNLNSISLPSSLTSVGAQVFKNISGDAVIKLACDSPLTEADKSLTEAPATAKWTKAHPSTGRKLSSIKWSSDYKSCTASLTCGTCSGTIKTGLKTTEVTENVKTKASTTTAGSKTVTAKFAYSSKTYSTSKTVTIPKLVVTAPTAKTLVYTGSSQTLINAGKTNGGTLQYSTDGTNYSTGLPKKTSVGIYKVYYKVVGNSNYNSVSAKYITVKIAPKKAVISSYTNTSTGIRLTWGKVTGATGYIIYRDGVKIKTITSGSTVTYTDISDTVAKAANGKAFKYTVKAYYKNSAGTYAYGAASTAKTAYRVKSPTTFTATAGTGSVTLKFSSVPTGMNYQIYRATSKTGTYSLVKTVSAGTASYKNTGLTSGKTYYYKIKAYKTVNSVKVYSAYTAVRYATVK